MRGAKLYVRQTFYVLQLWLDVLERQSYSRNNNSNVRNKSCLCTAGSNFCWGRAEESAWHLTGGRDAHARSCRAAKSLPDNGEEGSLRPVPRCYCRPAFPAGKRQLLYSFKRYCLTSLSDYCLVQVGMCSSAGNAIALTACVHERQSLSVSED